MIKKYKSKRAVVALGIKAGTIFEYKDDGMYRGVDSVDDPNYIYSITKPGIESHPDYFEPVEDEPNLDEIVERALEANLLTDRLFTFSDAGNLEVSDPTNLLKKAEAYYRLSLIADALNGDWVPDWYNELQIKYVIGYRKNDARYYSCDVSPDGSFLNEGMVHFKTRELAESIINHPRARREILNILFDVKE